MFEGKSRRRSAMAAGVVAFELGSAPARIYYPPRTPGCFMFIHKQRARGAHCHRHSGEGKGGIFFGSFFFNRPRWDIRRIHTNRPLIMRTRGR